MILLIACAGGPSDATRLTDVQVVASVVEPPEAAPGELVHVTTRIADPLGSGVEAWQWACVGEVCGEAISGTGTWLESEEYVPPELPATDEPIPLISVWTLACAEGLCEEPPDLADPFSYLADLPIEGVSLARSAVMVSNRVDRATNPWLDCAAPASTADEAELSCETDGGSLWGYATSGRFGAASLEVEPGEATYRWFADEPGDAELFVVLVDDDGGVALWEGAITAE